MSITDFLTSNILYLLPVERGKHVVQLAEIVAEGAFDLHMHTTASDGEYTPQELVQKAKGEKLQTIAVTDHDTLAGIAEATAEGKRLGMSVISGVELSTKEGKTSVDILGYGVTGSDELEETLSRLREGREDRAERILDKFAALGMPLSMKDVREFSKGGAVARPHIAKAVVKRGYVPDVQSVFDDYLADGKPCALDKVVLSPQDGIDLIHNAGGKAVLAHPVRLHDDALVEQLLRKYNFDGLEIWHRDQGTAEHARYRKLAHTYELTMTGGSDFHDDPHPIGHFGYHPSETEA